MKLILFPIFMLLIANPVYSQDDVIVGKSFTLSTAAVYDLSDPTGVNIEVSLWGFVRYPGRYKVPYTTTFLDLMSYAGGPTENSNLQDIRIFREPVDSLKKQNEIIKLNYDDMLWSEKIKKDRKANPNLQYGDIVIVPQDRRYTFRENLSFYLPIFTTIVTLATFIVTLTRR